MCTIVKLKGASSWRCTARSTNRPYANPSNSRPARVFDPREVFQGIDNKRLIVFVGKAVQSHTLGV